MNQVYRLTGMTCGSCESSIERSLGEVNGVSAVEASHTTEQVSIDMTHSVSMAQLSAALPGSIGKYLLSEVAPLATSNPSRIVVGNEPSWLVTYKPILLIFGFIAGVTLLIQLSSGGMNYMNWMRHFMAGFFLVFSFFKFLNLEGFASSYAMYDVIARKVPAWGFVYAFVELGLGVSYLINYNPVITNSVALVVMSVSIIGVLRSVFNKQSIQCACLGDIFNLPMSTVTIIEDGLMIVMSGFMLVSAL